MKKCFITLLLLHLFVLHHTAQNSTVNELKQSLVAAKQDTNRVFLLAELAKKYWYYKPDTALQLAQEGLTLARKIKFARGEAYTLNIIGIVLVLTGNYPRSLEACLQALKIFERIRDMLGIGNSNANLAYTYYVQEDYKQSLIYSTKTKNIAETIKNDGLLVRALINMGDANYKLNKLDSALFYTKKGYELATRLDHVEARITSLNNLGNILSGMDQTKMAMTNYRLANMGFAALNDYEGICEATLGMAALFKDSGQADSALYYARKSLEMAIQGGFPRRQLYASKFLLDYYESIPNIDSAYLYQKVAIAAKDSLFTQEKTREVMNLNLSEQLRQQEIAEAKAHAREERKQNIQMLGIGAFIPVFFAIVLLFSKRKTKPKTIEFMGLLGLLLLFEFIALFLHPYIEALTNHTPVLMLLILVAVASLLVPMHHKLEHWIKEKLAHKKQL